MSMDFCGQHTYPKARKAHECSTCFRRIDKGERYSRQFCIWDGDAYAWKQCLHCEAMIPYIDYDEGFNEDDYQCWEPSSIEELRVRVYLNKKWRNNAGELYPIPFQADGSTDSVSAGGAMGYVRGLLRMPLGELLSTFQVLCANCNAIKRIENGEHRAPATTA